MKKTWVRRIALGFTIPLVSCIVLALVLPGIVMRSRRDSIATALQTAWSVRLEEFLEGKILSTRELDERGRGEAIESIRGDLAGGVPFTLTMCFDPHHRMIARDPTGEEFTFTICFECDEAKITGKTPFTLPIRWRATLRQLFARNGMQVRPSGD